MKSCWPTNKHSEMKNCFLTVLCCLAVLLRAQTPITLGNVNMPGNGDTLRYTNVMLSSLGNYTQTGTNFTWNFGNVVSAAEGLRSFRSAFLTPYALFFLSLNEYGEKIQDTIAMGPLTITNYYNFYKKSTSPNAFIADGAGATLNGVPLPSYYSDKDELYNFPMTYPKYDSTTFRFATPATTMIPIRYSKTGYRVTVVDGWGTVTTPYGTQNCLRLITTQYSMDSIKTSLGPVTIPLGIPNNTRSYQWMTLSSRIPYMEVTGSLVGGLFTPTAARYRGFAPQVATGLAAQEQAGGLQLYPNPASDRLWVDYEGLTSFRAELYDVQGRLVKSTQLPAGAEKGFIDLAGLAPGVYTLKATMDGASHYQKFIKN
jgi:hypothetical protein